MLSVFCRSLFFKAELEFDELRLVVLSEFNELSETFIPQLPECSYCPPLELASLCSICPCELCVFVLVLHLAVVDLLLEFSLSLGQQLVVDEFCLS